MTKAVSQAITPFHIMKVPANTIVIFLAFFSGASSGSFVVQSFVQLSSNPVSDPIPYCENTEWVNCNQVDVNITALRSNQPLTLPNGGIVRLFETSPGVEPDSITVSYQSEDLLDSMTITFFTSGSNEVNGVIYEGDKVFSLAACDQSAQDCHVLAEENLNQINVEETTSMRDMELMTKMALESLSDEDEDRQETGRFQRDPDGTYVATIKIYYTREFAQVEPNVGAFISNMISRANTGFRNSQIPFRFTLLCTEQLNNINENRNVVEMLNQFTNIKGSPANLRGTADFAHLLVNEIGADICGRAHIGQRRLPFGLSRRFCARINYTFGHEVGHNFGCFHNRENRENISDPYAFGYLIPNTEYRTKMALPIANHPMRINYYSNPNVRFQNVPTGDARNNCARRIRARARAFASIGSDTDACGPTTASTTTTTTTTTTQSTSGTVISTCSSSGYQFISSGSRVVVQYPPYGYYGNNEWCQWCFQTSRRCRLRIYIEYMDIEAERQCNYDRLIMFGTSVGDLRFCGSRSCETYISSRNSICLRFISDASVVGRGFRVLIDGLW